MRCAIVACEVGRNEMPDAIGWKYDGRSILVECKASRADFLGDKNKPWRRCPAIGMGVLRYYMAPPGIIGLDDLPEQWGLCEVLPKIIRVRKKAEPFLRGQWEFGEWYERQLLISLLWRKEHLPTEG
jgi:hypothetical protein